MGLGHLQTDPLGFQFCNITTWSFFIGEIDLSKYIFLSILLIKFVTCITLRFIIMNFFYYKVVICNTRDKFLLAQSTKNILRGVNFTNLNTQGGYIVKSKPQRVCLRLIEILGSDYIIWPFIFIVLPCSWYQVSQYWCRAQLVIQLQSGWLCRTKI